MFITDTRPVKVNGFVIPDDPRDPTQTMHVRRGDTASVIICRMDTGAIVKSLHGALRGHQNYVRIHGNRGLMENCRIGDKNMLRIRREPFDKEEGEPTERIYLPDFPEYHELAAQAGHGGGDFFTNLHFARAIRTGKQPYLNVYRAVDMSILGILAYRSALNDSAPVEVPDFRDEPVPKRFEDDDWSPDPERARPGQPLPSILGHVQPSEEAIEFAREVWRSVGYIEE